MTLRDYQQDLSEKGFRIIHEYGILYLAMEVRTGKTLTALATADKFGARRVIFFTKKKAVTSVCQDYLKLNPAYKMTVTNYEQIKKYELSDYDLIIVDEGQNFGAFPKPSARQIAMRKFCAGKPVIILSGTPSPESYSQLYHQLQISDRSPFAAFTNFYKWANQFVAVKQKRISATQTINDYSCADGDKIWKYIKHLFLRYTQEQAGFEADVHEHFLTVDMNEEARKIFHRLETDGIYQTFAPDGTEMVAARKNGADLINKLCQVSSGTLIYDGMPHGVVIDTSKAQFIRSRFYGQKIAIFYKYKAEFEVLKRFFPAWTDSPEMFNASRDTVFLGQIQSAREGVNLSTADALVMYNIDFSATSYFQARARIQSKDRKGSAPLYWIFSQGGIERRIYEAVSNKLNYTYSYYRRGGRISSAQLTLVA